MPTRQVGSGIQSLKNRSNRLIKMSRLFLSFRESLTEYRLSTNSGLNNCLRCRKRPSKRASIIRQLRSKRLWLQSWKIFLKNLWISASRMKRMARNLKFSIKTSQPFSHRSGRCPTGRIIRILRSKSWSERHSTWSSSWSIWKMNSRNELNSKACPVDQVALATTPRMA